MHFPSSDQLNLSSIPEIVVGLASFQLLGSQDDSFILPANQGRKSNNNSKHSLLTHRTCELEVFPVPSLPLLSNQTEQLGKK